MAMINAMEPIVKELFEDFQHSYPVSCTCEQCRLDIQVIALNRLQPKYVTSKMGEVYIKTLLLNTQLRSDVVRELAHAADLVGKNPHHA
ncbi:late competence development ComFB family protein [Brevibacillus sp. SYP-B805]|uniref:late competence development ComFB family protein n=1 Tax=Brevibacillus sp. SYP-B805 TaxID=1578199 RepID=UPI0013EB4854|nr:late competence development ComFB family protein [Brevibacillus sp. SYP-B805]NGQ96828.1 late competence development ComFB family protein [Brevibacillus sp. SYP-B805]